MAFYGKLFVVEAEENFDAFVKALGLPEDRAQRLLSFKPSQKIEKDGDDYKFTVTTSKGDKSYKFNPGVEFDDTFLELPVKITVTVDGNKVTHSIKFDLGFSVTIKKEYTDDSINEEISHSQWDGVARRTYKAQ